MNGQKNGATSAKSVNPISAAGFYLLMFIFFVSGTCGLIYEVVFARLLVLVFGSTTYAVSTVLGVFMFGLAFGSYFCGRHVQKLKESLKAYALVEIAIGIYALLFIPLLGYAQKLHAVIFHSYYDQPVLLNSARILLCLGLLILPTLLMGATVPLISALAVRSSRKAGFDIGFIYASNTIGASLGCFGGAFFLIPAYGLSVAIQIAAGLNLVIGVACFLANLKGHFRTSGALEEISPESKARGEVAQSAPTSGPVDGERFIKVALICFFLSGLLSLVYEVAWTRALVLIFGSSVYAFSTMLTTFLVGLAAGSLVAGMVVDRIRNKISTLIILLFAIGLSVLAATPILGRLPDMFLHYFKEDISWERLILSEFFICFLIMFIPTFCSGALFPLISRIFLDSRAGNVGRAVANVYFVNTIGGIIGSISAGFILIPFLGVEKTLLFGSLASILVGFFAYFAHYGQSIKTGTIAVASFGLIAWTGLFGLPRWNPLVMNSGVYIYGAQLAKKVPDTLAYMSRFNLLYSREDHSATVAVLERGERFLRINGKTDGGTGDNHTQILLAALPSIYAKTPETALVIGLGTGITAGSILDFSSFKSMDCIEISPAVTEASHYFDAYNGRPLESAKTRLYNFDGRTWIMSMPKSYDVIVSEPSHPWQTGNANLFTIEFFQMARKRLSTHGYFCQWLPYYHMDKQHFRIILNSYKKVFPHVNVWVAGTDALLIGSNEKPTLDNGQLRKLFADTGVTNKLGQAGIYSVSDLLSFFWLDTAGVERFIAGVEEVNSDNNPVIEFSAPKYLNVRQTPETFFSLLENSYASKIALSSGTEMNDMEAQRIKSRVKFLQKWRIPESVIEEMLKRYNL
jgi:spermidine synthase